MAEIILAKCGGGARFVLSSNFVIVRETESYF
jgi:hypothetical protein